MYIVQLNNDRLANLMNGEGIPQDTWHGIWHDIVKCENIHEARRVVLDQWAKGRKVRIVRIVA